MPAREEKTDLCLTPFSKITEERVQWLWPAVVPYGKLTLFAGHPGDGKSLASVDLAARVSAGRLLPDGSTVSPAPVLLVFCEDGAGDTVKPRLRAARADLNRVYEVRHRKDRDGGEPLLDLSNDLHDLRIEVERVRARLVVLDPISAYLGVGVNSWKDDEVRRLLEPLGGLAEDTGCAIISIIHLNKQQGQDVRSRITGSGAFAAAARSVLMFGAHPEDRDLESYDQRKICAPVKMNLAKAPKARIYRIHENREGIATMAWEGETSLTSTDILAPPPTAPTDGKVDKAVQLLQAHLAEGPALATDLFAIAKEYDVSPRTVQRAKKVLRILVSQELTSEGDTRWRWALPNAKKKQSPPKPQG